MTDPRLGTSARAPGHIIASKRTDLNALRRMLKELERVLKIRPLPPGIAARSSELLTARIALTEDLLEQTPAAFLGSLGGQETAKEGSEYFGRIAALVRRGQAEDPARTRLIGRNGHRRAIHQEI